MHKQSQVPTHVLKEYISRPGPHQGHFADHQGGQLI